MTPKRAFGISALSTIVLLVLTGRHAVFLEVMGGFLTFEFIGDFLLLLSGVACLLSFAGWIAEALTEYERRRAIEHVERERGSTE